MAGCVGVHRASPKSERSVWGASSSDSDLGSLATRLRTVPGSAEYSQDGMSIQSSFVLGLLPPHCFAHMQFVSGILH